MAIPTWLTADNNGALKLVTCAESGAELVNVKDPALKYILDAQLIPTAGAKAIQRLAVGTHAGQNMVCGSLFLL